MFSQKNRFWAVLLIIFVLALSNQVGLTPFSYAGEDDEEDLDPEIIRCIPDGVEINDSIDNDGDGYIDEEIVDCEDNDGDGLVDEDVNDQGLPQP